MPTGLTSGTTCRAVVPPTSSTTPMIGVVTVNAAAITTAPTARRELSEASGTANAPRTTAVIAA